MRRGLRIVGVLVTLVGIALLSSVGWQIWGTRFSYSGNQDRLETELAVALDIDLGPLGDTTTARDDSEASRPPSSDATESTDGPVETTAAPEFAPAAGDGVPYLPRAVVAPAGDPIASLEIPTIDLDVVIVEGVDTDSLKLGPGHMPGTAIPGSPGNAVISGHRTTYGGPFGDLDLLGPGDEIIVSNELGRSVYAVTETVIVTPQDIEVAYPTDGVRLTLTTCHPKFSDEERLIVYAELVDGRFILQSVAPPGGATGQAA